MPIKILIELFHIALGLIAAVAIAKLSIWSYPRAQADIWLVAALAMAATAAMGIGPLRTAIAQSRAGKQGG